MRFEQSITIAAPPEAVWTLMADTDRMNREIGIPPILFTFAPRDAGGSDVSATIRMARETFRYREHPFEWVRPRFHTMRRPFLGGPLREITGGPVLEPSGSGTRVTIWAEIEPAGRTGELLARLIGPKLISDAISVCPRFEAFLLNRASSPYPRHAKKPPADAERLRQAEKTLLAAGADGHVVARMLNLIGEAPPEDLAAIRPYAIADLWGLPRR